MVRRICCNEVMGCSKDTDVFAQTVISANTRRAQGEFRK